ncbi:MAG: acyl carrier protein [Actinomycetales bacterium]|nr:acyl carrier protein [Actinomycetales bacterium]
MTDPSPPADPIDGVEARVLAVMARCLDLSEAECRNARWGSTAQWDSFAFVEIIAEIEERFGVTFDEADFSQIADFRDLAALVGRVRAG